jgi:predicted DNA-binding antitoxin AbrB/MazE fold protein
MIGVIKEVSGCNKDIAAVEVNKLDMEERSEHWINKYNKKYRDEDEKAMRFQVFKATVEWIESQPPSVQRRMFPEISFIPDFTERERRCMLAFPNEEDRIQNYEMEKILRAKYEKGLILLLRLVSP